MTARDEHRAGDQEPAAARIKLVTPKTMEAMGRKAGGGFKLSARCPFVERVPPYPPKDSVEMPGPVAEVYQLSSRRTLEHEGDFYQEDERLRQEIAADTATVARTGGLDLQSPSQRLSSVQYFPLMVAFGISEACVNVVIFLVLAMSRAGTLLASLMLAVGLPLLAHFAGKAWKQVDQNRQNRVVMGTAIGAAVAIVTVVAVIRCAYVSVTMRTLLAIHISPVVVAVVFWGMNLAVFAAATLASHAHAIADPEGEQLGLEVVAAEERLVRNEERRRTLRHEYRTRCQQCDTDFKSLAAAYFQGNMETRRRFDPEPPVWILHLPDVPIPSTLQRDADPDDPNLASDRALLLAPLSPSGNGRVSTAWKKNGNWRSHNDR